MANVQSVELNEEAARHIVQVLRLRPGDSIRLFNGRGGEYSATLDSVSKRQVRATLEEYFDPTTESPLALTLMQAVSRGEKMDYTLQKATELGVHRLIPIISERCGVKLMHDRRERRLQHWQGVITAACQQCGRNRLPELSDILTLSEGLQLPATAAGLRLILDHRATDSVQAWHDVRASQTPDSVQILIGPEGGWTEMELQSAIRAGFRSIQIGPRILRTETAAVAALSLAQLLWGDFAEING